MAGSALAMPIQSIGNTAYFGDPMMTGKQYLLGFGIGGLLGGTINGGIALFNGKTFWTGNLRSTGLSMPTSVPTLKLNDPEVKLNTEGLRTNRLSMPDEGLYVLDDARTAVQFDIEGVNMQYLRDPNFRPNLVSASGINPTDAVAHHVFPIKYAYNFQQAGVNVNRYGTWWTTVSHQQSATAYNNAWGAFFRANPNPSKLMIYQELLRLRNLFGF